MHYTLAERYYWLAFSIFIAPSFSTLFCCKNFEKTGFYSRIFFNLLHCYWWCVIRINITNRVNVWILSLNRGIGLFWAFCSFCLSWFCLHLLHYGLVLLLLWSVFFCGSFQAWVLQCKLYVGLCYPSVALLLGLNWSNPYLSIKPKFDFFVILL